MHASFMLKALEQARLGRGLCAPNPAVGAVIVQDGKIIAEGWHKGAGKAHAEQLALEQLPDDATNLTLYVTLEPCNHWGRTPPCALAICKSAVTKVVYGFRDPNPVVAANDTPKILEQQGIEVLHLPLTEIDDFYASYLYWTKTKMPWVTAKIAHSMDGKIGLAQQIVHLTNSECQYLTHTKRWQTDVILTTAKTIHADNPRLNARLDGQELKKHVAILDRELSLISKTGTPAQIFSQALHCHFFYDQGLPAPSPRDNCSYHPVATIGSKLDLAAVVH